MHTFNPESLPDFAVKSRIPSFKLGKSRIPENLLGTLLKAKLSLIILIFTQAKKKLLMPNGNDNEKGKKKLIGLISKARAAHLFVPFFAVVLHDYNVKLHSYTF